MTVRERERQGVWDRVLTWMTPHERTVSIQEGEILRDNILDGANADQRRRLRSNQDLLALSAAIFAAIRRRSRAVTRIPPKLVFEESDGTQRPVQDPRHPAQRLMRRVNGTLTFKQGMSLVETYKLTDGMAFWVKRRLKTKDTVVEFEIWNPRQVIIVPDKEKPWLPADFILRTNRTDVHVAPRDMLFYRHLLDPRNFLLGLAPIPAARIATDTGLEAVRYNQRFFDNDANSGRIYTLEGGGPAEAQRVEQEMERKFKGTDKAHRSMVTTSGLTELSKAISQKDMQFMEQLHWGVEEVGRVMEMAPVLLGDMQNTSGIGSETMTPAMRDFWVMIEDQVTNTYAEITEFLLKPDFDRRLKAIPDTRGIPELQKDRKLQAEVDDIELGNGKVFINELRERDGQDDVDWGDEPLLPNMMTPLSQAPPENPEPPESDKTAPPKDTSAAVQGETANQRQSREELEEVLHSVFQTELRRLLRHITQHSRAEQILMELPNRVRKIPIDVLEGYDWDMLARRKDIERQLLGLYELSLQATGFIETSPEASGLEGKTRELAPAHELAVIFARRRAGNLLVLDGTANMVNWTRARVRRLTATAIEQGHSPRMLKNALRADFASWSPRRAETVARTEMAFAQSDASLKSYESMGHEGKEWSWPGGEPDGICDTNDGQQVPLDKPFRSGHQAPPGHPSCRCALLPVRKLESKV